MAIQTDSKSIIDLVMGDLTQFHIPIYQRTYTWEADKHVNKLIDDILEFGKEYKNNNRAEYYIGNIIIKNQTRGLITERVVIDGQQRITTAVLILCAIRDIYLNKYESVESRSAAKKIQTSLYSKEETEIKLKLNNMEKQQALSGLLSASMDSLSVCDRQTRYVKNYNYIYQRLEKMDKENFEKFIDLLRRIKAVIICLDEDQDENSVFESINSLGKPLAGADLIKNFLFTFKNYDCSHYEEVQLTNWFTQSFESLFKNEKKIDEELESFFRTYIAIKTQVLVKKDPKIIYYSFKQLIGDISSIESCKKIILDLSKWALIYQIIRVEGHKDISSEYIGYLRTCFGFYATFLMDIINYCSHVESGELIVDKKEELNEAFKAVVAYDVSRFIANYPTGELARFIPTVFKRINAEGLNSDERISNKFYSLVSSTKEGYMHPSIDALKKCVINNDLYVRKAKKLTKFLILLENIGKNERLDYENDLNKVQIEHIMPQTLSSRCWSHISTDIHEKYLHTLGNFTLTFDNQKLSNFEFSEKKQILKEKSRMKLNNGLMQYDIFGAAEIEDRAIQLLQLFIEEYLNY